MGLDFIHNTPGKPWRKGWAGGLDALKTPGLFDIDLKEERRLVTMDCTPDASIKAGTEVVIQLDKGQLTVTEGLQTIGRLRVAEDVVRAVSNAAGVALGTVERVGHFGDSAEIRLR